ncbi:MAG: TPM domain-containing protein, partial [Bacteroidota bacterium]|nr:TPM domain-containing protein [Bacteroidota bacterium]
MKFKKLLFVFAILLSAIVAKAASDIPERPEPQRLVNDLAGILSPEQQQALEQKLVNFFSQTSTQIAIVTVKDLAGYDKADFATQLGHNWGIGQKDKNNGILILVKPKIADSRGEVFVSVGYGLEAVVPDAIAHRTLVDTEMIPSFKRNDYYGGLDKATNVLISLTKNEFTAAQYAQKAAKENKDSGAWPLIFIFIFLIPFLLIRRRAYTFGGARHGSSLPFWGGLALWELMGNRHSGYFNDFSSGSGDFGGGGNSFS